MFNLIRANRPFSIFLLTQGLSNLGDSVRNVAIPLLVLQITHAPILVAAVALIEAAPYFAFHLPIGALLDRIDRHAGERCWRRTSAGALWFSPFP
jgi:MFS family permease